MKHKPVLLEEIINNLKIKHNGIYVDCTIGYGGHSYEICKKLSKNGHLIGIDQDKDAIKFSNKKLQKFKNKITIIHNNFYNIKKILYDINIFFVDGIIVDLGISSCQINNIKRGFCYKYNKSMLDMRMNRDTIYTAKDIINTYSKNKLYYIFKNYGEEKFSKKIAKFICNERIKKTIKTTDDLITIIKNATVLNFNKNVIKRIFQSIRIELNNELKILNNSINNMISILNNNSYICIITFHSLEDRIVKNIFKYNASTCICPNNFPKCVCNKVSTGKIINKKPIFPSYNEINTNKRSKSAKLRIFKRIK